MKTLTKQQAIEAGYTKYGQAGEEFQSVQDLEDLDEEEIEEEDLCLFSKETIHPSVDAKLIIENIVDEAYESIPFSIDTEDIKDTINEHKHEISALIGKINKSLLKHEYWKLTDIKLISEKEYTGQVIPPTL